MTPFVVVGGGIAGLLAAWRLAQSGERVVLLESRDRLGGTLAQTEVAGIRLDAGAESFATRGGTVERLLAELGLADDVVLPGAGPAWLLGATGRSAPLPATGLFGIPARPLAPDVVAVVGRLGAARAALDAWLPRSVGADAESFGGLVRSRMGRRLLDRLVAPVVAGVYSSSPDEIPTRRAAPGLPEALARRGSLGAAVAELRAAAPAGSPVSGISGGVHRIAERLGERLAAAGVDVRLGTAADDLAPDSVRTGAGIVRGRVVLAAPTAMQRTVHVTTLVVEAPELDAAPRGTGSLAAADAPVIARALTHSTAKWTWLAESAGGRHVLRLSSDEPLDDDRARGDAERLLGVRLPRPEAIGRVRWTRGAPATETGIPMVGEAAAGTGIAAIVKHTEARVAAVLGSDSQAR